MDLDRTNLTAIGLLANHTGPLFDRLLESEDLTKEAASRVVRIRQPLLQNARVFLRKLEGLLPINHQAPAQIEDREDFGKSAREVRIHRWRLPQEAILREPADVVGHDAPLAECVDEGDSIAAAVVAHEIAI